MVSCSSSALSTVAKYMDARGDPSGQSWSTFLRNHAPHIAAMDLFVIPSLGFNLLYVLVIIRLARRQLAWINVTPHPTAEWIAQQITEAFPWNEVPRYLIRDRDAIYGAVVTRRVRAMGIRDKPIAAGAPWQNCFAERLIGSIRRVSMGQFTSLSYSGPRRCVWRGLQAAVACHGHSGQADCSPIAVAEPVRREADRHDPTGMSRPHDRIWAGAPAPDPGSVCRVL